MAVLANSDADLFIYDNDTVHRVWQGWPGWRSVDNPALLRAMIVALMEENKRLHDEMKDRE